MTSKAADRRGEELRANLKRRRDLARARAARALGDVSAAEASDRTAPPADPAGPDVDSRGAPVGEE